MASKSASDSPGMAHDDVGAQPELRNGRGQLLCQRPVHPHIVGTTHEPEHTIAAALERQMLMRHDGGNGRDNLDELRREVGRQHRREPEPAKPLHPGGPAHEGRKARPRREIPTIVTDVHAGQRDLSVARFDEGLDLLDYGLRLLASAPAPSRGDYAEGAAMLAAILDLDEGP